MTKQNETPQDSAFLRARRSLLLDHCFFGSLIMHLNEVQDAGAEKGLWVDGVSVGYNPATMEALDLHEGAGLLAKGVLHCALQHHLRRGSRDQKLWQKACDYVTNPLIFDSGLGLPQGAQTDRQYADMSAEQVYRILEEQAQQQGDGGGQGRDTPQHAQGGGQGKEGSGQGPSPQNAPQAASTGEVRDLPGQEQGQSPAPAEHSKQEQEWKINMQQALQNAKARGDLPGALQRMIEKALTPVISWKEETRRFMQSTSRDDLSWSRPNRRFIGQGLYLPAVHSERMKCMVVVNDTSGSTQAAQEAFLGEMDAIAEDVNPERIIYVQQDSRIAKITEMEPGDKFERAIHGGGGTDFRPVFAWLEKEGIVPDCMIFLTDLEGPFPEEPEYPVLWAAVRGGQAPFGETLHIDLSQQGV